MRNVLVSIGVGLAAGALSWASAGLLTERFEPFDTELGFYSGQAVLSICAACIGYWGGVRSVLLYLVCAYLGMNIYAFVAGGSEHRAWILLGMITTLTLLVYPLALGIGGRIVRIVVQAVVTRVERRRPTH